MNRCRSRSGFAGRALVGCALFFALLARGGLAQENTRLYELQPYDEITLKDRGQVFKVFPIEMKKREPVVRRPDQETVRVRLVDLPDDLFEITWSDLEGIRLFEEMLLEAAATLVEDAQFTEAGRYYALLDRKFKQFPGVQDAVEKHLFGEATDWLAREQPARSFALLNELHARDAEFAGLRPALLDSAAKLIERHRQAGDFAAVRVIAEGVAAKYPGDGMVANWLDSLGQAANGLLTEAIAAKAANRPRESRDLASRALKAAPDLPGARELLTDLNRAYPTVVIGVLELDSTAPDAGHIGEPLSWSASRVDRLLQRRIAERVATSEAGGVHEFPLASLETGDDSRSLVLKLHSGPRWSDGETPIIAEDLAGPLAQRAWSDRSDGDPAWRGWLESIEAPTLDTLLIRLTRAHPLPGALLEMPAIPWNLPEQTKEGAATPSSNGPYVLAQWSETETRFTRSPGYFGGKAGQFEEITERAYSRSEMAIRALKDGEIDILDRVPLSAAAGLTKVQGVKLAPYAFPTMHFLIPNPRKRLLSRPEFRRALAYATNAEEIVEQWRVAGQNATIEPANGPFPKGYANDAGIEPKRYHPTLAVALFETARRLTSNEGKTAPSFELTLAHPRDEDVTEALQVLRDQWNLAGAGPQVRLIPLPPGHSFPAADVDYDLAYVAWRAFEPIVDAPRLLGSAGLSGAGSPALEASLRRLGLASDWTTATKELWNLHRLAQDEVAVLPLWQTTEFLAYREDIVGIGERPATLYHRVEDWRRVEPAAPPEPTAESGPASP